VMANPGTKLYPCPAKSRQRTAFDGKPRKRLKFRALPLEVTRRDG
jgi:hypothetical protein